MFGGYEIHLGVTTVDAADAVPFATLDDGGVDGACADASIGTYLHGALESSRTDCLRREIVRRTYDGSPTGRPKARSHVSSRLADWFATQHAARRSMRLGARTDRRRLKASMDWEMLAASVSFDSAALAAGFWWPT